MRARNIKPGFFKNEELAECSLSSRLCFVGLWMLADRDGRLEDRPKRIKAELFAFDSIDVAPLLVELERYGFIMRYKAGGVAYIQIASFSRHQRPHIREKASEIPPPPAYQAPTLDSTEDAPESTHAQPQNDQGTTKAAPRHNLGNDEHALNPDTGFLNPDTGFLIPDSGHTQTRPVEEPPPDAPDGAARAWPSMAAAVCMVLKAEGIAAVNPGHPELNAMIDAGADAGMFAQAGRSAVQRGKGFAYALATVRGQMADAARAAAGVRGVAGGAPPARASPPEPAWRTEQRQRTLQAVPGIAAKPLAPPPKKLIETGTENVVAIAVG